MNEAHRKNRALKRLHKLTVRFETIELAKQLAIKTTVQPEKYVELLNHEAQQVQERARQIGQSIHAI